MLTNEVPVAIRSELLHQFHQTRVLLPHKHSANVLKTCGSPAGCLGKTWANAMKRGATWEAHPLHANKIQNDIEIHGNVGRLAHLTAPFMGTGGRLWVRAGCCVVS
jgi:hypothetical protein